MLRIWVETMCFIQNSLTEIVVTCLEFVRGISAFSGAEYHEEAIYTILYHKDSVLLKL